MAGTEAASHTGEHTTLTSALDWGLTSLWAEHTHTEHTHRYRDTQEDTHQEVLPYLRHNQHDILNTSIYAKEVINLGN